MTFPHAVALTGGISTGKSSVCALLKLHGFHVIDADAIAHQVLQAQSPAIRERFGAAVFDGERVDRKKLGGIVFADPQKRKILEGLLHPFIRDAIFAACGEREAFGKPYIVDIPLFYETGAYPITRVVVVYASRPTQRARLMQRDGLTSDEADRRLAAQIDIDEKKRLATDIVDNNGDLKHLQREVDILAARLKDDYDC